MSHYLCFPGPLSQGPYKSSSVGGCVALWSQMHLALTGFLNLIHFTVPNVRAALWACTVFLCGDPAVPPSSKQSDVTDTFHSYLYLKKLLCSLRKGLQSDRQSRDSHPGYHFVGFYLSSCGQVCLLVGGYAFYLGTSLG